MGERQEPRVLVPETKLTGVEFWMHGCTYQKAVKKAAEKRNIHGEEYGPEHGKRFLDHIVELAILHWLINGDEDDGN